ncbi:MAG: putative tRNA-dihydrouridine synthase [Phycisphaerae bacterium]|nr:putative tRNA-dihydrouridine synthase [Phycisphaerae bacterium]
MLKIGPIELPQPFVQAALSGYSDLPMRTIARRAGCCFTLNEVVLDQFVTYPGRKNKRDLAMTDEMHPVAGQLMGSDPTVFAEAARIMVDAGYDVIDINFGCPVKKVLGRCRGGWMLSHPPESLSIVQQVFDAVGQRVPVTVKMRRGLDDSAASYDHFMAIFEGAWAIGISAVTVHGRTVEQRYKGPSKWEFLRQLKAQYPQRTILGSGDLFTAEDCVRMIRETGVDGVTVARGCIGNPWVFRECAALWAGREKPAPPTIDEQRQVIGEHYRLATEFYGFERGSRIMRKHCIRYSKKHPSPKKVRMAFISVKKPDDWQRIFDEFYNPHFDYPLIPDDQPDLIAAGADLDGDDCCGG